MWLEFGFGPQIVALFKEVAAPLKQGLAARHHATEGGP